MRIWFLAAAFNVAALASWAALVLVLEQVILGLAVGVASLLAGQAVIRLSFKKASGVYAQRMIQEAERGRKLAIYNPSTGLLAQWYLELRLEEEAARGKRYGIPFVVLTLEGSPEKATDERNSLGYGAGQAVSAVTSSVRRTDLVGTIGFSQFAVCLIQCDRAGAVPLIRRMMDALGEGDWRLGMAVYPDDDYAGRDLIKVASQRSAPWRVRSTSKKLAA